MGLGRDDNASYADLSDDPSTSVRSVDAGCALGERLAVAFPDGRAPDGLRGGRLVLPVFVGSVKALDLAGVPVDAATVKMSVVLPVMNGVPHLASQLESIARQEAPFPWETIVVDNGSSDGTWEVVASFEECLSRLLVLEEPVRGKSNALNRGAEAARGELLVFLDQDDVIAPGYLAAMAEALDVYPFVASRLDDTLLNADSLRRSRPRTQSDGVGNPFGFLPCATGCSIGIRRSVFQEVGGFDPSIQISDDVDFSWRVQLTGYPLAFAPEAVLHYRYRSTLREIFGQARSYGTAGPALYKRYGQLGMPRRSPVAAVRFHTGFLFRLARARSWSDLAACVFLLGFRIGILEGSLKNRVLYL